METVCPTAVTLVLVSLPIRYGVPAFVIALLGWVLVRKPRHVVAASFTTLALAVAVIAMGVIQFALVAKGL